MKVLICGGGVIGASLAYFLSRRGAKATVIERCAVACAASGKAGGFLALDWCDGTLLQQLARRSFALHAELAETLGVDWGYRRLSTFEGFQVGPYANPSAARALDWLAHDVATGRQLGTPETTAQVDPGRFTSALMQAAREHGAELRIAEVTDVVLNENGTEVRGVCAGGETVAGDAVVIAMGPWSAQASAWLPIPPVSGSKGHSLVFETASRIGPEAVFLEARDAAGTPRSPEIFPRPDGTTWASGVSSTSPVPDDPAAVAPDPGAAERLRELCGALSPVLRDSRIRLAQACFRPVTRDGLPLIGAVPGVAGAYVATGHSVWGILNAPATGEALAELILDGGARSVDLTPFDAARMAPARAQRGTGAAQPRRSRPTYPQP